MYCTSPERRQVTRRVFIGGLLAFPLLGFAVCDSDGRSQLTDPDVLELLAKADPKVAKLLQRSFEGPTSRLALLSRFFADANAQKDVVHRADLPLMHDGPDELQGLPIDTQLMIIRTKSYRFYSHRDSHDVVLVFSSQSESTNVADIDATTTLITYYLPKLDLFWGNIFNSDWLHVELDIEGNNNFGIGLNLLFTHLAATSKGVVAHELVHILMNNWTFSMPVFIEEGIADLLSYLVTGDAGYSTYATGRKVRLRFLGVRESPNAFEESGNGFLLFKMLLEEVGIDHFTQGLREAYARRPTNGLSMLSAFKRTAPDKDRIEALYQRWIEDYVPGII